jgi:hypothetical protein
MLGHLITEIIVLELTAKGLTAFKPLIRFMLYSVGMMMLLLLASL